MPDDAPGAAPAPTPAAPATTATAAEPRAPKWGDDPETIPQARRDELLALHAAQVKWLAETGPDRDTQKSPFAQATRGGESLTGVEVHLLKRVADDLHLEGAFLFLAHLEGADLTYVHLEGAALSRAHLEGANLFEAHLEDAYLIESHLEGASLHLAHLEGADLSGAHLEGGYLIEAHLEGADLRGAFFSTATNLARAVVFDQKLGLVRVADVRWQDVNLAVISWPEKPMLGDEREARALEKKKLTKRPWTDDLLPPHPASERPYPAKADRQRDIRMAWQAAARAYRQMASVMREQGMSDEADRFAYRGQCCQRRLLRLERRRGAWAFSALLWAASGYGYRLQRILVAYVLTLAAFTLLYVGAGAVAGTPLAPQDALLISFTAIHGRVFLGQFGLHSALSWIAGVEAVAGIVVEGIFVAMLIQRFFGK